VDSQEHSCGWRCGSWSPLLPGWCSVDFGQGTPAATALGRLPPRACGRFAGRALLWTDAGKHPTPLVALALSWPRWVRAACSVASFCAAIVGGGRWLVVTVTVRSRRWLGSVREICAYPGGLAHRQNAGRRVTGACERV